MTTKILEALRREREQPMSATYVTNHGNVVSLYCKGSWVYKEFPSVAHAVGVVMRFKYMEDEELVHETAEWEQELDDD